MDWQAALRARLVAASPVTTLVGQRVYWVERPQGSLLPAITLLTIGDTREQHLKGFDTLQGARVQVDIWAANFASARAVTEAMLAAIVPAETSNGITFSRAMVDLPPRDLSERIDNTSIFRTTTDLLVHHSVEEGS